MVYVAVDIDELDLPTSLEKLRILRPKVWDSRTKLTNLKFLSIRCNDIPYLTDLSDLPESINRMELDGMMHYDPITSLPTQLTSLTLRRSADFPVGMLSKLTKLKTLFYNPNHLPKNQ